MFTRVVALLIGLFGALAGTQFPEFAQQYRQRLGGALDALRGELAIFDRQAAALGLDRGGAIRRLAANSDPLAQKRAEAAAELEIRVARIERQATRLERAAPIERLFVFFNDPDREIARQTFSIYEPAIPVTSESVIVGAFSGVVALAIAFLARFTLLLPFRRRKAAGQSALNPVP